MFEIVEEVRARRRYRRHAGITPMELATMREVAESRIVRGVGQGLLCFVAVLGTACLQSVTARLVVGMPLLFLTIRSIHLAGDAKNICRAVDRSSKDGARLTCVRSEKYLFLVHDEVLFGWVPLPRRLRAQPLPAARVYDRRA
jgi:hypothetical protein